MSGTAVFVGPAGPVLVAIVAVAMIALVPLGLRLLRHEDLVVGPPTGDSRATTGVRMALPAPLVRWWPVAGAVGTASLLVPRGGLAAGLAGMYLVATAALATVGARVALRAARRGALTAGEAAVVTALATPAVGSVALLAERWGYELFGFELAILALTVPHMHYAGFVAALVAAAVVATAPGERWALVAGWSVPAGTLTVLVGYFVGEWLELVGAVVLTAGMWAVAVTTLWRVVPSAADRGARHLLQVAAVTLPATMVLALGWAVGEATGLPWLGVEWMILTHGLGNAIGFGVCALAAWTRLRGANSTVRAAA